MDKPKRIRIDKLLVDHGYFDSRERAQRSILAGCVLVEENVIDKPGTLVRSNAPVRVGLCTGDGANRTVAIVGSGSGIVRPNSGEPAFRQSRIQSAKPAAVQSGCEAGRI